MLLYNGLGDFSDACSGVVKVRILDLVGDKRDNGMGVSEPNVGIIRISALLFSRLDSYTGEISTD